MYYNAIFFQLLVLLMLVVIRKSFVFQSLSRTYLIKRFSACNLHHATASPNDQEGRKIETHLFSVAPMMEYTDRHLRFLLRLISSKAVLYTEMVAANALVRSDDKYRFLEANLGVENPLVMQLGGADPIQLKQAAQIAYHGGYREINLNIGCPSQKVAGAGCFGAALMREPNLVSELALVVGEVTNTPATIKCRIGVDSLDSYDALSKFIGLVSRKGKVRHFIVHARKAVLGANFSPAYNREVPPLKYDFVYRLVSDFPHLYFTINGGVHTYDDVIEHYKHGVQGVMVGRAIINNPYYWRDIDRIIYNCENPKLSRSVILTKYADYANSIEESQGPKSRRALLKPVLNLFHGVPNGRVFRAQLDTLIRRADMPMSAVIATASECLDDEILHLIPPQEGLI
mmetsp:Transcript_24222/g.24494  ORF Transcript_24222/g.24494 Transcript_24222/m.24494 type:complete len:400 (+) Transcript_24222:38-1237(+)